MSSFRIFDRRVGIVAAAFALLLSAVVPVFASAAQITTRSIAMSSSSAGADNVSYEVNFTSVGAAGAAIIDFCTVTPLIGEACATPTGFDATDAASVTAGFTGTDSIDANTILVPGTIGAAATITVDVTGMDNPDAAGALYARVYTYDTAAHAVESDGGDDGYASATSIGSAAYLVDQGSVAMSVTPTVGVSAAVLETLTFCVSSAPVTGAGCSAGVAAPTLELGETTGTVKALSTDKISTGDIYTQVSSNAASGVVVNLKNNRTCGGLARMETPAVCEIAPSTGASDFADVDAHAGVPKFGVKVAADTATDSALSATGTLQAVAGSDYSDSAFHLNWVSGNATGVSSVYGDQVLNTGSPTATQPSNKNMKLTFGASIAPNTPAGRYSAELSLIATGKF